MMALHWALFHGHTETAMALVKAGTDVHCKATDGYGSRTSSSGRLVCRNAGRTVRPLGGGGVAVLAVQGYGAALCVGERLHRAGDGAGEGGRGCALQGQRGVRFLEAGSSGRLVCHSAGRTVRPLGVELQEWL